MEASSRERPGRREDSGRAWWIALLTVVFVFGFYEVCEALFMKGASPEVLIWFHRARGIGTALLTAGILIAVLARKSSLPAGRRAVAPLGTPYDRSDLRREGLWLIRLRWMAFVAIGVGITIGIVLDLLSPGSRIPMIAVAAVVPAANVLFTVWMVRTAHPRSVLICQICGDLAVWITLAHCTGGIESPLVLLGTLHVILAGLLLPKRGAFGVAAVVFCLAAGLAWAETAGGLGHHPLAGFPFDGGNPVRVILSLLFLGTVVAVTSALTVSIMEIVRRGDLHLAQAGKMAAIGELSGALAHEINNPVAIIAGKAENLLKSRSELPEKVALDLEKISHHARRIGTITHGLLAYSRPSVQQKTGVDLNRSITEAVDLVRSRARGQGVQMETNLGPDRPRILGNPGELTQVVINLANNALDAMPRGGRLTVTTVATEDRVVLEVSDTGGGMTPEVRSRLFEPFFTTKTGSGTGLGLAICHGLVRNHGGQIDVTTAPDEGTTFRVTLPLLQEEPA